MLLLSRAKNHYQNYQNHTPIMSLASFSSSRHQSKTQVKHFKKASEKVLAAASVITMQITSDTALELRTKVREDFRTMEKAPSGLFS